MRRILAVVAVLATLSGTTCSAEVGVDDTGDGPRIQGDVDQDRQHPVQP